MERPPLKIDLTEAHLGEVRREIVEFLESWLEREVSHRYKQIDQKLDSLMAATTRNMSPKAQRKTSVLVPKLQQQLPPLRSPRPIMRSPRPQSRKPSRMTNFSMAGFGMSPSRRLSSSFNHEYGLGAMSSSFNDNSMASSTSNGSTLSSSPKNHTEKVKSKKLPTLNSVGSMFRRGSFTEDSMQKRKLDSQRYKHEVQQVIAQNQRGYKAVAVWRFLENPYSSMKAWLYSIFIPMIILLSVFISFLQTVQNSPLRGGIGMWMQACFESLYAAELIVRLVVCPDRVDFLTSGYNWIDAASAMPIILRIFVDREQMENDEHVTTSWAKAIIVTLPLVRLLKIIRRFEKFHLLLNAFSMAFEALPVLLYTLMLIALLFSVLIYYAEPLESIGSLPTALWFVFVTMTTVGYGDFIPETVGGHCITVMLMIISFLYMAIPIGIVGNAFSQVWGNRDRLLLMHRIRESFLQEGFTAESMRRIVSFFDDDGDGELDLYEFKMMLDSMHVNISEERVILLHDSIDRDGGGTINVIELINSLFPKGYFEAWRRQSMAAWTEADSFRPPAPPLTFEEPPKVRRVLSSVASEDTTTSDRKSNGSFKSRDSLNSDDSIAPAVTVAWIG